MDLQVIYDAVGEIATQKVNVNSYHQTSPYIALQSKSVEYAAVCYTIESARKEDNTYYIDGILYYADRLKQDGSNWVQIQTDAFNILFDIVRDIANIEIVEDVHCDGELEFFNQRLTDYVAGGYIEFQLEVAIDDCEDYDK